MLKQALGFLDHRVGGQNKIYKSVIGGGFKDANSSSFFYVAGSCAGGTNLIVYSS